MALKLRIALLAAPETTLLVLFGLYDVLLSVGAAYPDMTGRQVGKPFLNVQIVGADGRADCDGEVWLAGD